jgi:predicted nucleic acid-binding protein
VEQGVILDASVIVGWFLPDEIDPDVERLRATVLATPDAAIVPRICWMEVAHALVRATRRGRLPETAVMSATAALEELMTLIPAHDVDPAASMRLALDIGSGAFDAAYLVLARATDRPLLTRDQRLAGLAADAGVALVATGTGPSDRAPRTAGPR